jgi:hypothetical protein
MVIPPYVPSLDRVNYEVVIYPDRDPGAYLIGTQEADLERDIDSFALKPTSSSLTLLFRRLDNKLPSRIVTGLRILQPNLSAECSLGVIHHNRPKKHFHWMLVSGSLDTYILFTKVIEIYGSLPVDFKLSLTLYSEHTRAPLKADFGSELLNMAQDRAIPLGLLFEDCKNHLGSNFGYLTVWSNYPGLVMYSALKKNDSITLEHSF